MSAPAPPLGGPATGALAGVRVVDLTSNVLGPMATQILGDMGADVLKIEAPAGDPMRQLGPARRPDMATHFLAFNRNKRSVVLDLKHAPAHAALLRLMEGADVFVHNLRLGAVERLGLHYAALAPRNPRLVYAAATGYRKASSRRDHPALDDVIQGESGVAAMLARAEGAPHYVPMALADKLCGVVLASAIGMALFHRERSGRGQELHVPMLETMVAFNLADHFWEGTFDAPGGSLGYPRMFAPQRRPHRTQDGHVALHVHTDAQWRRLFAAIGRPALADDPRFASLAARTANIEALYALVGEAMRERTTADWCERLRTADIPSGPMNDMTDLLKNEHLRETGFFRRYTHPDGTELLTTDVPVDFSATPGALRLPPPALGQHTQEVLAALGYGAAEIARITAGTAASGGASSSASQPRKAAP